MSYQHLLCSLARPKKGFVSVQVCNAHKGKERGGSLRLMPLLADLGSDPFHTGWLSRALLGCLCSEHPALLGLTSQSYSRI